MKGKAGVGTLEKRQVRIGKVHQGKIYDYIRKVEIDGLPRIRAYAEAIDAKIYDLPPGAAHRKLDRVREEYPQYDEIKEMVLAEEENWAMRKSHAAQDEALSLLLNTLKKANDIISKDEVSAQDLNAANAVLKTVMPAVTAVNEKSAGNVQTAVQKKARAERYIN
jgi:hypothetical protein